MSEDKAAIHVVYASDDRYAPVMGVSLESLLMRSADADALDVSVLEYYISPENRSALDNICVKYGREKPRFISMVSIADKLGEDIRADRGSVMQYARLFIGELPFDRVIYLDCDVLIRKSISGLWKTDLNDKTAAAMPDVFSRYYRESMELDPEDPIYNDGVMVVDLKKWRREDIEKKALSFLKRHGCDPLMSDLGVINAVFRDRMAELSPNWNVVTVFYDFSYKEMMSYRKPPAYYDEDIIIEAVSDPYIVHFTSSFRSNRPWEEKCAHPFVSEWLDIKAITPWADMPLSKPSKSIWNRIVNTIPRSISIYIVTLMQVYLRPAIHRLKEGIRRIVRA